MEKLLKKIGNYTLFDALAIEKSDRQFLALERLYKEGKFEPHIFFSLILANATVGYLLSSTGENYWEEFAQYFKNKKLQQDTILSEVERFLPISKGNKRLNTHKSTRLKKLGDFHTIFLHMQMTDQKDFLDLQNKLCKHMKQKTDAKTITFTLKMLGYAARIVHKRDIVIPFEIDIPVDSRLTNIYAKYSTSQKIPIKIFYKNLSEKMKIPPIHLDGILWTKYEELMLGD